MMYFFPSNFKYFLRKKHFLAMAGFARPGMLGKRVLTDSVQEKVHLSFTARKNVEGLDKI